ncbi:hypothetical protein OIU80_03675 [Flavobacterium sp. LS1R47]|uniref:Lipoprotein n=1 Tax=Flavobacterium frigoritolerans TaxID=2987686 RepID=A0A9X2ZMS0_9FLAO|nr:hypothetical protein [Flavobacterium frigoritolerans]MCV9931371.1 hypothetical protein [Flavobacterium frigoritolerans]
MKKTLQALCALLVVLFIGCSSDKEDGNVNQSQKTILNISDAKSLVILEESSTGKNLATETNLFKITADGKYQPVNFTKEDNSSTNSKPIVRSIKNLNSTYVLLSGSFNYTDEKGVSQSYSSILVRKTDGAIFNSSSVDFSFESRKLGEILPKPDSEGNIYYYKGYNSIGKLSLNNPDNINVIDYLPTGQTPMFFEVDPKGNCMYQYSISSGLNKYGLRIKKANGGIHEVKIEGRENKEFWLGNNGKFYFITYIWNEGYIPQIHKINIDGDTITTSVVWPLNGVPVPDGVGQMFRTSSQGSFMIKKENSVVFIDTYYTWGDMNWEFFENSNSVESIELPHVDQYAKIVYSKENYYIATKTDLYKVNLDTHEYIKLLNSGEYEVYTISVDANDKLQFSALRLKDGKKIFAEINKEGALKTTNEEINRKATVLERIN